MIKFRPLKAEEVDVRVGQCKDNGVSLLLFKDARVDMSLLDEVVGPECWECRYEEIGGKLFCTVSIYVIVNEGDKFKTLIDKQDVGVPSNMESTKGEASDAFKRACFKWGIGRELYTAPFIWVPADKCNIKKGKNGKPQCYDDFRVTEMEVEDGQIVKLQVCNMSKRGLVVYGNSVKAEDIPESDSCKAAWERVKKSVWEWCQRHDCATEAGFKAKLDGIRKRPEWESQSGSLDYLESLVREFEDG